MDPWARRVAEGIKHPVGLLEMHGQALYVNAAWRSLLGVPNAPKAAATSIQQLLDLVHPEDRPRLVGFFDCPVASASPHETRRVWVRIHSPNHEESQSWWTIGCAMVLDDDGRPVGRFATLAPGVQGTTVDDVWRTSDVTSHAESLAHVGAWDWDILTGRLWWSDQVYRIFGLTPDDIGVVTLETFLSAVHPDERESLTSLINDAVVRDSRYDVRHRVVLPGGEIRFVRERAEVIRDGLGTPIRMLGTVVDVTATTLAEFARDQAVEALAESEDRYRLLAENASDVVWQVNAHGVIDWVSESIAGMLGWSPQDVIGRRVAEFLHPDELAQLPKTPQVYAEPMMPGEFRLLRVDGTWRWMSVSMQSAEGPEGHVLVGSLRDVQAQVEMELELEHVMAHDPVTGLASRDAMVNRIAGHLRSQRQRGQGVSVMCISIDSLGTVNGAYSYAAGDRLLGAVAGRIGEVIGDPDLLGRGAGNELFALVPNIRRDDDAKVVAERILLGIRRPVTVLEGQTVTPTVSIGIATTQQVSDPEQLLQGAALAMQQAKLSGRNRYQFLDTDLAAEAQSRLAIEADIREGLLQDQFTPWFQPIVSFRDGVVVGHEALVRWVRHDESIVEAWRFLPVAERGQLIAELDQVVLRKSIAELAHGRPGTIAVNVSAASLRSGTYDTAVMRLLEEFEIDPTRLHLEVTETALLSISPEVQQTVGRIAQLGVAWFVDDFGTGYSSISHLRDLPISGLKLDKSFTAGIGAGDETCLRLADGLVGLAEGLGLETIAEGVETEDEAHVLRLQGWSYGQGWLYGRATPKRVWRAKVQRTTDAGPSVRVAG